MVLISNNPYHLATPHWLGRRFSLATGQLGAIVLNRPAHTPPDLLRHLRSELRQYQHGVVSPPNEGVVAWSAPSITPHGDVQRLDAGIDGETVRLPLPVLWLLRLFEFGSVGDLVALRGSGVSKYFLKCSDG